MSKLNPNILPFSGSIEGYVVNYLRANFWRVKSNIEYEDMMQEAFLIYLRLASKYSNVDSPQHFMALFKTSWNNHFVDFSNKDSSIRASLVSESDLPDTVEDYSFAAVGDLDNNGYLLTMIRQAPEEVAQVLSLFLNAPTEILELASRAWKEGGHNCDYGNKMLCKLLGVPKGTDVISLVEEYFTE